METLSRLVSESLARHGFDRPVDYRRLQWSRWFRCESHHSLLVVPSKPGVFALAEEVMAAASARNHVGTDPLVHPTTLSEAKGSAPILSADPNLTRSAVEEQRSGAVEERRFSAASGAQTDAALAAVVAQAESAEPKSESPRMLAVAQFFEDDDMAFILDRMLSHQNRMRDRLASGRYFFRFVVIEDPAQRRSVCNALNQWILSSAEKATGIGSHFATSLELTPESPSTLRPPLPKTAATSQKQSDENRGTTIPRLNSAVATTIHCSSSFPSGF